MNIHNTIIRHYNTVVKPIITYASKILALNIINKPSKDQERGVITKILRHRKRIQTIDHRNDKKHLKIEAGIMNKDRNSTDT